MSVNKYKPHVWVVPEDDANRELANGFLLHPNLDPTAIDIRPAAGGWPKVLDATVQQHALDLRRYPDRHLVLLVDLDGQGDHRIQHFRDRYPADVHDRIYLLSTKNEPERLKAAQGRSLEKLGEELAEACAQGAGGLWLDDQLQHNQPELDRLMISVKPVLFPTGG